MSRLSDFYNQLTSGRYASGSSPWQGWWRAYQSAYDTAHGAERAFWKKVPVMGNLLDLRDQFQQAQDTYENTGKDYAYSTRIAGSHLGFGVGLGTGAVLKKMASSLGKMYDAEIEQDCSFKRYRPSNVMHMYPRDRFIGNPDNDIDMEEY